MKNAAFFQRGIRILAFTVVAFAFRAMPAHAAEPSSAEAVVRDATTMFQAFIRGDLDTFSTFTYPAVVTMAGGKEGLKAVLQKGLADMRTQGFAFLSVSVDTPTQRVKAGAEVHALVPMEIVIKTPQGEMHAPSYLLGISRNKGKTWTFVDTDKLRDATTRDRLLPRYNKTLVIPDKKAPWIVPTK